MMDADEIASAIGVMLHVAGIRFRFKGEGTNFGPQAVLIWDTVVIEAFHPLRDEWSRLHSIEEAEKFLDEIKRDRAHLDS